MFVDELPEFDTRVLEVSRQPMEGITLLSLGSIAMAFRAFSHPEGVQHINEVYRLHLGQESLQVHIIEGEIKVHQGESKKSIADFHTTMQVFLGLFTGQIKPHEASASGPIRIEGDSDALQRFLSYCYVPGSSN